MKREHISEVRRQAAAKSAAVRAAPPSVMMRIRSSTVARCREAASKAGVPLVDWASDALEAAAAK